MAIPVTTRSGKGSPLTQGEMDTNLINLSRSATESAEGNIEISTQDEVDEGTDDTTSVSPLKMKTLLDVLVGGRVEDIVGDRTDGSMIIGQLHIKWGNHLQTTNGVYDFDTPFPTECFGVLWLCQSVSGDSERESVPYSINTVNFTAKGSSQTNQPYFYLAIGN